MPWRRVAVSVGVGVAVSVILTLLSEVVGVPAVRPIVRPFGLLGFAFGNVHQGSYLISESAMVITFSVAAFLLLTIGAAVGHTRRAA
jgi:hypothetical protein